MEIENVGLFHSELVACGLSISGCSSDGTVHILSRPSAPLIDNEPDPNWTDPTDSIIEAVKNAHNKLLSSDECLALKSLIGDEIFLNYVEARKEPVRNKRAEIFKSSTDSLLLAAMEESTVLFDTIEQTYNVKVDKVKWDEWVAAKSVVRENNPYPE